MVSTRGLDKSDMADLKSMLESHLAYTRSGRAKSLLDGFATESKSFVKVIPNDYQRVLDALSEAKRQKMNGDDQMLFAFTKVVSGSSSEGVFDAG